MLSLSKHDLLRHRCVLILRQAQDEVQNVVLQWETSLMLSLSKHEGCPAESCYSAAPFAVIFASIGSIAFSATFTSSSFVRFWIGWGT